MESRAISGAVHGKSLANLFAARVLQEIRMLPQWKGGWDRFGNIDRTDVLELIEFLRGNLSTVSEVAKWFTRPAINHSSLWDLIERESARQSPVGIELAWELALLEFRDMPAKRTRVVDLAGDRFYSYGPWRRRLAVLIDLVATILATGAIHVWAKTNNTKVFLVISIFTALTIINVKYVDRKPGALKEEFLE